jgi:large subunit ribosomal protein L9
MELILKKDVDNLGFADDVVTVKNGYGRNYLIPQGYAVLATSSAKKVLAENLKQRAHKEEEVIAQAKKDASKLDDIDLKMTAKAGTGDKLFGSITDANLSEALAEKGVEIDRKFISIFGGNIKRLGQYDAKIRFHREVVVDFTFDVVAEA